MSHHYREDECEDFKSAAREWRKRAEAALIDLQVTERALANLANARLVAFERWAESAQTGKGLRSELISRFGGDST